jgi:lipid-binding SYLF domain-containing protein
MEAEILARLLAENDQAAAMFEKSAGYAAFDMRQVTIFPVSGGYGRGVAVSHDGSERTYMEMGTGGMGAAFGIGGFASQFVIMFETPIDFDRFVTNGYDAAADAGMMAGEDRASETVQFSEGRSTFVLGKTGWRVNANLTGTKYWRDADLN